MSTMRNLMFYASIFTSLMFVACDQDSDLTSPSDSNSGEVDTGSGYTDTVADVLAGNCVDHDDSEDYQWDDALHSNNRLIINGGYIAVNADGDGFDINGSIIMTDGTVIVHGPTANMNGAVDYDRTFNMSGGFLVAARQAASLMDFTKTEHTLQAQSTPALRSRVL